MTALSQSSLYHQSRLSSWRQIRSASHGAGVSLLNGVGEYVATFDCALAVSRVLGTRGLESGSEVPTFKIPTSEVQSAIAKLSARYSVALVDVVADKGGELKFVCVWRVESVGAADPKPDWDDGTTGDEHDDEYAVDVLADPMDGF